MKKILSLVFIGVVLFYSVTAQPVMQASIGPGSTPTRIKIYVRPTLAVNGNISTFQFDIAIASGITPAPQLSILGTPTFGSGWVITPSYVEDGFRHYEVVSSLGGNLVLGAGIELEVMQLEFSGGPATSQDVAQYTLPAGGTTGNALFYCSGAANSEEGQLYYNRGGVTVVNNNSYTGSLPSSATISGILLPVSWLNFDVIKKNNDALLSWSVANEELNDHFEILRSVNGRDYNPVGTVNKNWNGNSTNDYSFTDVGIDNLGASILYYRLRQIDINGKNTLSDIRILRLEKSKTGISIFPNPVTTGFYVSAILQNSADDKVILKLVNISGQQVLIKTITAQQATNYYVDISGLQLSAGQYQLQILKNAKLIETSNIIIAK